MGWDVMCTSPLLAFSFLQLFPEFELKWLVDEFNKNLPLELDFMHEARNAERAKANFAHHREFYVPRIVWVCACLCDRLVMCRGGAWWYVGSVVADVHLLGMSGT